jgi:hypothetical protein
MYVFFRSSGRWHRLRGVAWRMRASQMGICRQRLFIQAVFTLLSAGTESANKSKDVFYLDIILHFIQLSCLCHQNVRRSTVV